MDLSAHLEGRDVMILELHLDHLDAGNVREFKERAPALLQDHARVVVDLSGVSFIDSSGLGALISLLRVVNGRGGQLRLCAMSRTVRALFELMRMHRVFVIDDTRDDAVRAFA